jgi:16S rRNA (uracil1498-N3)-methyltransferase
MENGEVLRITGDEMRHLVVTRVEKGETLEAFDGTGMVWTIMVESVGRGEVLARVTEKRKVDPDAWGLILAMALVRTAAFEFALEKAAEIGVSRIIPFQAGRSNIANPGSHRERWLRIIQEATKQSKRYRIPVLDEPLRFDQILTIPARSRVMFVERDGGPLKPTVVGPPVLFLIGPEGGWSQDEVERARDKGFACVGLGSGVLKAETAAIVGGALIRYELGDKPVTQL